jgi:type VI secretion system protein ImpC
LRFAVPNRLEQHGSPVTVELRFGSMADFEPTGVARQLRGFTELIERGHSGAAEQLDEVLHAPAFQALEATWRGLQYLLGFVDPSGSVKVRVFDAKKQELLADFRESEPDNNAVFQKVSLEPYIIFGGEPTSVVIGDYEFSNSPDDLELLDCLADAVAVANAPFLAAASPHMFGCASFAEMHQKRGVGRMFEGPAYTHWRSFRQSPQAGFACLVLPRILLRPPYRATMAPGKAFLYDESDAGLWGNAAFALGARLADAFRKYHWCGAIEGLDGGGLVTGLPADGKGPAEVAIDDVQEKELGDNGFNCLAGGKGGTAAFFRLTTCLKPKQYVEAAATQAARLSTRLSYVLAVSRFAHYLKALVRDHSPAVTSKDECERLLNQWIKQYVLENPDSAEDKARFPLRDGRVKVEKAPGTQDLQAIVSLRPHFQVADPGLALRVGVSLPPPAR